jgi:hypothetical protein
MDALLRFQFCKDGDVSRARERGLTELRGKMEIIEKRRK